MLNSNIRNWVRHLQCRIPIFMCGLHWSNKPSWTCWWWYNKVCVSCYLSTWMFVVHCQRYRYFKCLMVQGWWPLQYCSRILVNSNYSWPLRWCRLHFIKFHYCWMLRLYWSRWNLYMRGLHKCISICSPNSFSTKWNKHLHNRQSNSKLLTL